MYLKATLASLSHKSSLLIAICYLFLTIVDTNITKKGSGDLHSANDM